MEGGIAFIITTYNRPSSCRKLVEKISEYGDIYILNDGSSEEYEITQDLIREHKIFVIRQKHNGKKYYWRTINNLFNAVPKDYKYYFMIPDDFLPVDGFVNKTIDTWNKLPGKKICINPYVSRGRLNKKNWTKFHPVEGSEYRKIQWVDMCFMCEKEFFERVGVLPYINLDWENYPERSSGVGSHISWLLHNQGYGMYQTKTSLFIPQKEAFNSKMNAWRIDEEINIPVL